MDKYCTEICDRCPFRRDSQRGKGLAGLDPSDWLDKYAWPLFAAPQCRTQGGAACLGWAVYLANACAACMVPAGALEKWVESWDKDDVLIFDGCGEFIRYHRGEHHGSKKWREECEAIRITGKTQSLRHEFSDLKKTRRSRKKSKTQSLRHDFSDSPSQKDLFS